jgi:hypothetical protein
MMVDSSSPRGDNNIIKAIRYSRARKTTIVSMVQGSIVAPALSKAASAAAVSFASPAAFAVLLLVPTSSCHRLLSVISTAESRSESVSTFL